MNRLLLFFFVCICGLTSFNTNAEPLQVTIEGESAILMNAETGAILFEKNAHALHYPASTTKIACALYVLKLKKESLNTLIKASSESLAAIAPEAKKRSNYMQPAYWLESDGTHIGIKKDEELTLHDLLRGMLIPSGNDAANVIAEAVAGNIPQFMTDLNAFLKEIGCQHTSFLNPHGLHHPEHQTTAYDLALMTREALKDPIFCDIVSQTRFLRPKTNKQKASAFLQTNRLLRPGKLYYPKAIGVKTGYHSHAKKTFVGAARSNERTLIVVLLKNQDRNQMFQDAIKLFDAAFNQPKVRHILLKSGPQKFAQKIPHTNRTLQTYLEEDLSVDYYPAEDPKTKCFLYWDSITAPIQKNQKVGELHLVSQEGQILKKAPLLASEEVALKWPYHWIAKIRDLFQNYPMIFSLSVILVGSILMIAVYFLRCRSP